MIILLLVGDGDKKRTARRKLLSPVVKVIGAAVGESYFVVDVGENARDNKEAIDKARQQEEEGRKKKKEVVVVAGKEVVQKGEEHKEMPKEQKQASKPVAAKEEGDKVIKKKTTKSKTVARGGKHYKVTITCITYSNGEVEEE